MRSWHATMARNRRCDCPGSIGHWIWPLVLTTARALLDARLFYSSGPHHPDGSGVPHSPARVHSAVFMADGRPDRIRAHGAGRHDGLDDAVVASAAATRSR